MAWHVLRLKLSNFRCNTCQATSGPILCGKKRGELTFQAQYSAISHPYFFSSLKTDLLQDIIDKMQKETLVVVDYSSCDIAMEMGYVNSSFHRKMGRFFPPGIEKEAPTGCI